MTTRPQHGPPYSVLGMYPFAALRDSWDAIYARAAARVAAAPPALRWDLDPHSTWLDADLALGMACGWPVVTSLAGRVHVVGAFVHDAGEPGSHLYRSVIVASAPSPVEDLAGSRAAVNSEDSLSGHISLLAAVDCVGRWPGEVVRTGSHVASIAAVRDGAADIASIDAATWSYLRRDAPESLDRLHVVGRGPAVPGLSLVVPASASAAEIAAWRAAFGAATSDPSTRSARDTLMIRGFVVLDASDYSEALAGLVGRYAGHA